MFRFLNVKLLKWKLARLVIKKKWLEGEAFYCHREGTFTDKLQEDIDAVSQKITAIKLKIGSD